MNQQDIAHQIYEAIPPITEFRPGGHGACMLRPHVEPGLSSNWIG